MKIRHIAQCLAFAVMALSPASFAGADEPFAVEVIEATRDIPLGIEAEAIVRITNVSGETIPTAFLNAGLKLKVVEGPPEAMRCLTPELLRSTSPDPRYYGIHDLIKDKKVEVPAGWTTDVRRFFLPPEPGEYTVVFTFWMTLGNFDSRRMGEPEDNWVGKVSSAPLKVRVHEPQGADAEAFEWFLAMMPEDYYCSRAERFIRTFGSSHTGVERADLLRQYPDSVYTARHVVRRLLQFGIFLKPKDMMLRDLSRDIDDLHATVPCPPPEDCHETGMIYLRGADYVAWKLAWCERILEHHPEVWFADNTRYMAAAYRWQLGDSEGCITDLESLAKKSRPYVAAKAGGFLSAIKAKELEEKEK